MTCAVADGYPSQGQAAGSAARQDGLVSKGSNELGGFLRSRRERLTPEAAGIAPGGTRRAVPGLRREELAELAGVSVSYYTRLEQGASGSASDAVIDALAAALQLAPAEHEHLRNLAAPRRAARPRARRAKLRPAVRDLLAAMSALPAVVVDHRADVLAWNRLGHALLAGHVAFGAPDERVRPNIARMLFLDPHHRALYRDWADKASVTVAALHQAVARHGDDPVLEQLVGRLARWRARSSHGCGRSGRSGPARTTCANSTIQWSDV